MAHLIEPFTSPISIRSALISNPPATVPSVEELLSLEEELRTLQAKTEKRVKKAESDIKQLDAQRRKQKEKETKLAPPKRDQSASSKHGSPDAEEYPSSRVGSQPRTFAPPKPKPSDFLKKKKRKHDGDSDGEGRVHKLSKPSPAPSLDHKKQVKPVVALPQRVTSSGYRIAEDFSEPSTSTLPPRPVPLPLPVPGPQKATEVTEDFSKAKPPTQTSITTFYSSVEPWLRPIREDEVALLQYDGDTVEPFLVPPLGRHYGEAWHEEDMLTYGHALSVPISATHVEQSVAQRMAHNGAWDPSSLKDDELSTDERGIGPVTERLVAALLPTPGEKPPDPSREEGSSKSVAKQPPLNVMDLEERIKGELMAAGLLADEEPDFSASEDQILAELRRCQRALREQMNLNKARRQRVHEIAQDRLAYQEFVETRELLDRQISSIYSRLQKRDTVKSASSKKRKKPGSAALAEEKEKEKPHSPAALGLGPDPGGKLVVSEQLKQAVDLRRAWVEKVGSSLNKIQQECPGRLWGLPPKSIYEGLEEDVKKLEREKEKSENG